MNSVLNIAAYRFALLPDAPALRATLFDAASTARLKGTILLAEEGLNLFLAGEPAAVRGFVAGLRRDARFADLEVKESFSDAVPFRKLLVKVKREIIRMDHPAIRPGEGRAPGVDAATLSRWLDQGHDDAGREVVMLDTRNAFEVDHGAFENAVDWRISRFTEFPAAVDAHPGAFEGKTVVSYCTGGIRCEKAAIFMQERGIENVLQLEGGILKYFETVGDKHFRGQCFVFDEREALDAGLAPVAQGGKS